ncbi:MAG: ribonuclease R [Eubacteriales bacterium]|nr:ribonuclease R [Eubacteriales bacterium]
MENLFEKRKETVYKLICDPHYVPMKIKEIAIVMQVAREDRPQLETILLELQEEGKIELTKRGKYKKAEKQKITGNFVGNAKGFGFVEIEGWDEDVFIPESGINGAIHGDTVEIEVLPGRSGKRREGYVVKIISHVFTEIVGTYEKCKNFGFVIPDNQKLIRDIFIPQERSKGAVNGHKVVVELTDYGTASKKPEGKVVKIIGHANDPGVDILSIVYGHELPTEFPERVLNQAERVAQPVSEADMQGRLDLRDVQMVTIDGEDAKDLDDAVSLSYNEERKLWHLGVHIADVTNYVQENSALDREAQKRGTSVYLVDRVIPMLPHTLSNGMCSLNQGEDRLALSCLMDIDSRGNVTGHQIAETVICVNQRMSYTSVNKIITDHDAQEIERYEELVPMFFEMEKLANILREKRRQRGSIDFDFPESKMVLDENGKPVDIKPYDRNAATRIIEDFMLIANETVAQDYFWQEIPFVYRTHDNPDPEKIRQLALFVSNFGFGMKGIREDVHPKELQKLLARIEDSPQENLISRLTLRSMKQAKYTVECTGHFGLAAKYYCHFTSPIRRYPDLQIHRIIRENLRGRMNAQRLQHYEEILPGIARQCSRTERRAEEAERDVVKMKKAEFMQMHIGEIYEGIISGMHNYGFYVELPNTVEGMVHVSNLYDDRYYFDEKNYEMYGTDTGKVYCMGQSVKVRVLDADKETRTIDFQVVADDEEV